MTLRRVVKTGAARILSGIGADVVVGALNGSRTAPLILGYHRVVEDFDASARVSIPSMLVSTRMLERHLDWIGRHYHFIGLDELAAQLEAGTPFDRPVAAVTFDDGYADVYENGLPLLQRKGIPGAVFVVTDLVGTDRLEPYDRLYLLFSNARQAPASVTDQIMRLLLGYGVPVQAWRGPRAADDPYGAMRACFTTLPLAALERLLRELEALVPPDPNALKECRAMDWAMVTALHRAGFTVGSHTRRHVLLPAQPERTVLDELVGSRRELQRRLETRIRHFAYPDGRFTTSVLRMVARAGYVFGFTTCGYRDPEFPLLTLPRRLLWEHSCVDAGLRFSPSLISCQVNGLFDPVGRCAHDHRGVTVPAHTVRGRRRSAGPRTPSRPNQ